MTRPDPQLFPKMKNQRRVTSGEMISDDLLTEILVRLPVKSLLLCKSVSKPWLSLISSPNFINSHMKHTVTTPGADHTLLVYGPDYDSISPFDVDNPRIEPPLGFPFSRGDFPFEPDFHIVGSCNGVVCVSVSYCPRDPDADLELFVKNMNNRNDPDIYLWNPATKHSKNISRNIMCRGNKIGVSAGFGFDPVGNDFKVLRFFNCHTKVFPVEVYSEVYSANTNVWRTVEASLTDHPRCYYFDVCVNGLLCCIGLYGMVAFDYNKEVFTCGVRLPSSTELITEFNDSVAVITSERNERNYVFNLWTLDDEACLRGAGIEASWTLMLTLDVDYFDLCVYGCFNNGDFLLKTTHGFVLLDNSDKKEARKVLGSIKMDRRIIKYSESLISITGSKQVDWNAHGNDS